jgi:hypothetical protein
MNARLRQVVGFTRWLLSYVITIGLLVMFGAWAYTGFTASQAQLATAWEQGSIRAFSGIVALSLIVFPAKWLIERAEKRRRAKKTRTAPR